MTHPDPGSHEHLEELVGRCIDALEAEGTGAVNRILEAHPAEAPAIRKRLDDLSSLGLLRPTVEVEAIPEWVGQYRILEEVGKGGQGVVFLAEQQEPVKRRVALKLVKVGMDTHEVIRRFEVERQALALMNHPNIARVFDAGATEQGRPFFVMEYVPGVPITLFCDQQHLSIEERLHLFLPVCEAVQHAHHKGIIHRDLKPTNVLVMLQDGKPEPKIIDFGVAKATDMLSTGETLHTRDGMILGTPEYMSPEQAGENVRDVDTRTDVYALGMMLYELLTGTLPFGQRILREVGYGEMLRIIREEEPLVPSVCVKMHEDEGESVSKAHGTSRKMWSRRLRGDLDWITLRSLEKDRSRRYETPLGLAEDVRRHLNHEPVTAGPPGRIYRIGKFLKKHRQAAVLSMLLVLVLVCGIIGTTLGLIQARKEQKAVVAAEKNAAREREKTLKARNRELEQRRVADIAQVKREEAEKHANLVARVNRFFVGIYSQARKNPDVKAIEALDLAAERLDRDDSIEPEVEMEIRCQLGNSYSGLQRFKDACKHLRIALRLHRQKRGRMHFSTLRTLTYYAQSLVQSSRFKEAEELLRPALEEHIEAYGEKSQGSCTLKEWLGRSLYGQNQYDEARDLILEVVNGNDVYRSPASPDAFTSRAQLYSLLGKFERALDDLNSALELKPDCLEARIFRITILYKLEKYDRIEADIMAALEKVKRAELYVDLFRIRLKNGADWLAARSALEKALEINPELTPVHNLLAGWFWGAADRHKEDSGKYFAKAAAFYAEGLHLGGENREIARKLVAVKKSSARSFLRGEEPEEPLDFALRGFGFRMEGNTEDAAADLARGIELLASKKDPGNRNSMDYFLRLHAALFLAELAENLGRLDQSTLLYRRVLNTLDPHHSLALDKIRSINR